MQREHFCVNYKKNYFHSGCLGVSGSANIKGIIHSSYNVCSSIIRAELSQLDKFTTVEKTFDYIESVIRGVTMLRNEIALIKKSDFLFLKTAKVDQSEIKRRARLVIIVQL